MDSREQRENKRAEEVRELLSRLTEQGFSAPMGEKTPSPAEEPEKPAPEVFSFPPAWESGGKEPDAEDMGDELRLVMTDWERDAEGDKPEEENDLPLDEAPPPAPTGRRPLAAIGGFFAANFPRRTDTPAEWARKGVFWVALAMLVVSAGVLFNQIWLVPTRNRSLYNKTVEAYEPDKTAVAEGDYPKGMLVSFQKLYNINPDVRGFLDFSATGNKDFLNIHYPVVYSGDNEEYLRKDFYGNRNKNGALFFDRRNDLMSEESENRVLIIYGHNMASGQMFAGLNKLIGNVQNARAAASLTLGTLYEKSEYQVLAVVLADEEETEWQWRYDFRRTRFSSEEDFLQHIENIRARSLFDYPTDVQEGDELLVLSTCTAYSSAKLRDGRLLVIARKVRPGEGTDTDTDTIVANGDVIMPRAWYMNQNLPLHSYYSSEEELTASTSSTTAESAAPPVTTESTAATTSTDPSASTTPTAASKTAPAATTTTAAAVTTTTTAPSATAGTDAPDAPPTSTTAAAPAGGQNP